MTRKSTHAKSKRRSQKSKILPDQPIEMIQKFIYTTSQAKHDLAKQNFSKSPKRNDPKNLSTQRH